MNHLRIAVTIAVTTVVSACGSTEPEIAQCQPETQVLVVTTQIGENVVFDWTPACGVRTLFLEQDFPPENDVWQIESPDAPLGAPLSDQSNVIMPPVTYGTVPPGALLSDGLEATPLIVGQSYLFGLFRVLPTGVTCNDGTTAFCRVANFTFTR